MKFLMLAILVVGTGIAFSQEPPPDPDPHRFDAEIQRFVDWDRQNAVPREGVLFVGSSSIRGWMTAEYFPGLPVINRGFGGSHISDVIFFAEKIVLPYRPRVIVFYAGDNDVAAGKSAEQVLADYRQFVHRVAEKLPQAKIIYLPIKPSLARWDKWPEMEKANERIAQLSAENPRLYYADTATPMLGADGKPRTELLIEDGLHLTPAGYRLWTDIVAPMLEKLRAE